MAGVLEHQQASLTPQYVYMQGYNWSLRSLSLVAAINAEICDAYWKEQMDCRVGWRDTDLAQFESFLRTMLKMGPRARPTAEEVLDHPWLTTEGEP